MASPLTRSLCLAAFLLWTCQGQGTREIRIGVSLSLTGVTDHAYYGTWPELCYWCKDVVNSLRLWERFAEGREVDDLFRTQTGDKLTFAIDVLDDGGSLTRCIENYQQMMQYTDFFLGPSYARWNWIIQELLQAAGKAVVMWAMNPLVYESPPFEMTTDAAWLWQTRQNMTRYTTSQLFPDGFRRRLQDSVDRLAFRRVGVADAAAGVASTAADPTPKEARKWLRNHFGQVPPAGLTSENLTHWFVHQGAPADLAHHMGQHLRTGGEAKGQLHQPPARGIAGEGEEDTGSAQRRQLTTWELRWEQWASTWQPNPEPSANSLSLDVAVEEISWAKHSLQLVYEKGARKFLFIFFNNTLDAWHSGTMAYRYAQVARHLGDDVWSYAYPAYYGNTFLFHMRVIRWVDADAIFICGTGMTLFGAQLGTEALGINPHVYISSLPFVLTSPLYSYARSHFLEPSPIPPVTRKDDRVFGDIDSFIVAYRASYQQSPGYAGVHGVSALTLLLNGFENAPALTPAGVIEHLRQADDHANFLGPFNFDVVTGARMTNTTFTRQVLPIKPGAGRSHCEDSSLGEYSRAERFNFSMVTIVGTGFHDICKMSFKPGGWFCSTVDCQSHFVPSINYPVADYQSRAADSTPCADGCVLGLTCMPCEPGKYHSWGDRSCRDCPSGKYAHTAGLTACVECQSGASCAMNDRLPLAQAGFYIWNGSEPAQSDFDCTNDSSKPYVPQLTFVKCRPVHVCGQGQCIGVNTGVGCRQCPPGWTYQGLALGRRECRQCPSIPVMTGLVVLFIAFYAGLTFFFSRLGYWASFGPGFMPCPFARAALHYFHLLGVAFEVTSLDSRGALRFGVGLLDLLFRPFDLLVFHCLDEHTDSWKSVQNMSTYYKALMVAGFAVILALFVCAFLWNVTKNFFVALWLTFKGYLRQKKITSGSKHAKGHHLHGHSHAPHGHHGHEGRKAEHEHFGQIGRLSTTIIRSTTATASTKASRASRMTSQQTAASSLSQSTENTRRTGTQSQVVGLSSTGDLLDPAEGENPSTSSDESELTCEDEEEERMRNPHFSLLHGPGLNFTEHLESLALARDLRTGFVRVCFAWILVSYPVCLRGIAMTLACDRFEPDNQQGRMALNYDIVCGTPDHERLIASGGLEGLSSLVLCWFWCLFTPLLLWIYLYVTRERMRQAMTRLRGAVLFDGYRSGMAWWEGMQFLRNGVIIMYANDSPDQVRIMLLGLIVLGSFTLQFVMRPYETRYREFLQRFDLMGLMGVSLVLAVGLLVNLEESARNTDVLEGSASMPNYFEVMDASTAGLLAYLVNLLITIYGFVMVFHSVYSMRIQAIIESGGSISTAAMKVHRFVQIYPGVSPVYYLKEGGSGYIDISQLTKLEKYTLARNMNDMVSVCIDNDTKFKLWVVERALDQAFRRALETRQAALRILYHTWGTKPFYLGHLIKASLRAPDIITADADGRLGVTVDELNDAMMDVIHDILEFHPCIFGNPDQASHVVAAEKQEEGRKAKEWSSQVVTIESIFREMNDMADGDDFDSDEGEDGTASPTRFSSWKRADSMYGDDMTNAILDEFDKESKEYQEQRREALAIKQDLQEKLYLLEEEYETLQTELGQPSTTPSTADQLADAPTLQSTYRAQDATETPAPSSPTPDPPSQEGTSPGERGSADSLAVS